MASLADINLVASGFFPASLIYAPSAYTTNINHYGFSLQENSLLSYQYTRLRLFLQCVRTTFQYHAFTFSILVFNIRDMKRHKKETSAKQRPPCQGWPLPDSFFNSILHTCRTCRSILFHSIKGITKWKNRRGLFAMDIPSVIRPISQKRYNCLLPSHPSLRKGLLRKESLLYSRSPAPPFPHKPVSL